MTIKEEETSLVTSYTYLCFLVVLVRQEGERSDPDDTSVPSLVVIIGTNSHETLDSVHTN